MMGMTQGIVLVALAVFNLVEAVAVSSCFFILKDLRDRIARLEERAMK